MLKNVQIQKPFTDFDFLMYQNKLLVKRKLESWNSQIESKTVD